MCGSRHYCTDPVLLVGLFERRNCPLHVLSCPKLTSVTCWNYLHYHIKRMKGPIGSKHLYSWIVAFYWWKGISIDHLKKKGSPLSFYWRGGICIHYWGGISVNYLKKKGSPLRLSSLLLLCSPPLAFPLPLPPGFDSHIFLVSGGKNRGGESLLGRELRILGRRGSKGGEAWTGEKRRMGRKKEMAGWGGELSRVKIKMAGRRDARGRGEACTVSY